MAIRINDNLSQLWGDNLVNDRRDIWLWKRLQEYGLNIGPLDRAPREMRNIIAECLSLNPHIAETLKQQEAAKLLHQDHFKWIHEGKRQISWVSNRLLSASGLIPFMIPTNLHGIDRLYYIADCWEADITYKRIELKNIEELWRSQKNTDKPFRWFKDDNQKILLAWEWLTKNTQLNLSRPPFEDYEDLLIYFDENFIINEQRELYLTKIKARWSQQKYRSNLLGKSQYNFILSDKAIRSLDKICEQHEISRARAIEILIAQEEINATYIAEKLKNSNLLNQD